ncbi:MAG: hypothetical protein HY719_15790 [Planctomycetes bacterium]|nr:hypothetical protein [Planctomycetota bacterium]
MPSPIPSSRRLLGVAALLLFAGAALASGAAFGATPDAPHGAGQPAAASAGAGLLGAALRYVLMLLFFFPSYHLATFLVSRGPAARAEENVGTAVALAGMMIAFGIMAAAAFQGVVIAF